MCVIKDISLINDTYDLAIPYLCKDKFIKSKLSQEPMFLKIIKPKEYQRVIIEKRLNHDEIYIKEKDITRSEINTNMKLLKVIKNGHSNPWMYGDPHLHSIKQK